MLCCNAITSHPTTANDPAREALLSTYSGAARAPDLVSLSPKGWRGFVSLEVSV
jgi:hypothetical protein